MGNKFQTNLEAIRLYDASVRPPAVTKVGILPFIIGRAPPLQMLFMKPCAGAKHLGDPGFQIAKGTRRINVSGDWCDMREDDLRYADESFHESLIATALREGHEEVGLKSHNIRTLFDMGGFTFLSASRGIVKPLHMFAAEIIDRDDFDSCEATTAETQWLAPEEFVQTGRADHHPIAKEIAARLMTYMSSV